MKTTIVTSSKKKGLGKEKGPLLEKTSFCVSVSNATSKKRIVVPVATMRLMVETMILILTKAATIKIND